LEAGGGMGHPRCTYNIRRLEAAVDCLMSLQINEQFQC
jgi:hypothetical protein